MKKVTYGSWVASFVTRMADYLNIVGWEITIEHVSTDKGNCAADIQIDNVYMQAHLATYPLCEVFFHSDPDKLVRILTHELSHILLDPFSDHAIPFLSDTTRPFFTDMLENQTQKLTAVLLKNLPKSIIPPR
jgi:hypothetical protein